MIDTFAGGGAGDPCLIDYRLLNIHSEMIWKRHFCYSRAPILQPHLKEAPCSMPSKNCKKGVDMVKIWKY